MPFQFVYLCDLLCDLEAPYIRDVPMLPKPLREYKSNTVRLWLQKHRDRLNDLSTNDLAVISMFQPEKWVDRDFGIDIESMERMLARVFGLSRSQVIELRRHKTEPHNGDLGAFVERVAVSMERVSGISYFSLIV
ncbi:hypothetical protein BGZ60DRAFT_143157 [Tricladium varicosporioides]|nr:hypothetical protein BGZ60DRAFT_143157 [Hymenoscyphus varicosporioides]